MATKTSNIYGKIVVTNRAIKDVANTAVADSYGVAGGRVMDILCEENKIYLCINIYLRYGVTPEAVCESLRKSVKYHVEEFTGMSVSVMIINVVGVK
jgi:uncharacterized alkaline shock family protein YloU